MNLLNIYSIDYKWVLFVFVFLYPVAIPILSVSGKPVDLVLSDIVIALYLLAYVLFYSKIKVPVLHVRMIVRVLSVIMILACLAIAGSLSTNSILPVISGFKYIKPLFAIIAGILLSRHITLGEFWDSAAIASLILFLLLFLSQFLLIASVLPRWGSELLSMDTYGFPNSFGTFLIIPTMFMLCKYFLSRKLIYLWVSIFAIIFVFMTLSRSASVAASLFFISSFAVSNYNKSTNVVLMLIMITLTLWGGYSIVEDQIDDIYYSFQQRLDRTFESDDPFSGRTAIAAETLELVSKRPLFGYLFESFDNYHDGHSTAHNQYLESLFKTGSIGFVVYFGLLGILLKKIIQIARYENVREMLYRYVFLSTFIAILASNLSQPNYTYSLTGNIIFLLLGFIFASDKGNKIKSRKYNAFKKSNLYKF